MNIKFIELVLVFGILILVASGFSPDWIQTSAPTNQSFTAIILSADGRVSLSFSSNSLPIISTNSGNTWITNTASSNNYTCAASSADGRILIAARSSSLLSVSTNTGITWSRYSSSPTEDWMAITASADGKKIVAASYIKANIWLSTNTGSTWQRSSAPSIHWTALASSADGTKLMAAGLASSMGQLYISTNSGQNWELTTNVGGYIAANSVASSVDGQVLAVAAENLYISTNSGSAWQTNAIWGAQSIALSADGKNMIASGSWRGLSPGSQGNYFLTKSIFTSTNFGGTWASNNFPIYVSTVASSADGSQLMLTTTQGIYMVRITSSPQLNIQPTNSSLVLSWLWPSTNFALQQNVNLDGDNWITLTNTPIINYTNLQEQVVLSSSNRTGFFRLSAQ